MKTTFFSYKFLQRIKVIVYFISFVVLVSCSKKSDAVTLPTPPPPVVVVRPDTMLLPDGVNLQPSYYSGGNVDLGFTLMKQNPKIKSLRIEIEPTQVANAVRWISEAIANGYNIICTYHKASVLGSATSRMLLTGGKPIIIL